MSPEFEKFLIKVIKIILGIWLFIFSLKIILFLGFLAYAIFGGEL